MNSAVMQAGLWLENRAFFPGDMNPATAEREREREKDAKDAEERG